MKFNIFLVVFGAALVSTAVWIPYPWSVLPIWIGVMGCCNGVYGLIDRYRHRELWR